MNSHGHKWLRCGCTLGALAFTLGSGWSQPLQAQPSSAEAPVATAPSATASAPSAVPTAASTTPAPIAASTTPAPIAASTTPAPVPQPVASAAPGLATPAPTSSAASAACDSSTACTSVVITARQLLEGKLVRLVLPRGVEELKVEAPCSKLSLTPGPFAPEQDGEMCVFVLFDDIQNSPNGLRLILKHSGQEVVQLQIPPSGPQEDSTIPKAPPAGSALGNWQVLLHIENDLGTSDQNYTDGERLEVAKTVKSVGFLNALTFANSTKVIGGVIGLNMYTPTDISWPEIIKDERPYAGWMYGGIVLTSHRWDTDPLDVGLDNPGRKWRSSLKLELSLGALGDPGTGAIQRWIHYAISDSPNPIGWEKGFNIKTVPAIYASARWLESMFRLTRYLDVSAMTQLELGNVFTRAHIGGMLRAGWYRDGAGPESAMAVAHDGDENEDDDADPEQSPQYFEAFAFGRAGTALVAWNGTLQGSIFRDDQHTVTPRRVVPVAELGGQLTAGRFISNLSFIWRGPEVQTVNGDPFGHRYWQLQLGWAP